MFWIKRQSNTEKKITRMHNLISASFSNVRRDTQNIFQWLNFLYQKNISQEKRIQQLQLELSYIPKRPEDIKKIIDSYYSFDQIMDRIKALNDKIDSQFKKGPSNMEEIERRIKDLEEQRKSTMREKVVKRVTRNSKEYVKSLILSYIRKYGRISSVQLKDMIVYDQGLCSKSSLYRLLDEIDSNDEVGSIKKGREKYYIYNQMQTN